MFKKSALVLVVLGGEGFAPMIVGASASEVGKGNDIISCKNIELETKDGVSVCGSTFVQEKGNVQLFSKAVHCRVSFELGMEHPELIAGGSLPAIGGFCEMAADADDMPPPDETVVSNTLTKYTCKAKDGAIFGTILVPSTHGTKPKSPKGASVQGAVGKDKTSFTLVAQKLCKGLMNYIQQVKPLYESRIHLTQYLAQSGKAVTVVLRPTEVTIKDDRDEKGASPYKIVLKNSKNPTLPLETISDRVRKEFMPKVALPTLAHTILFNWYSLEDEPTVTGSIAEDGKKLNCKKDEEEFGTMEYLPKREVASDTAPVVSICQSIWGLWKVVYAPEDLGPSATAPEAGGPDPNSG
jgi:hypothetical protein